MQDQKIGKVAAIAGTAPCIGVFAKISSEKGRAYPAWGEAAATRLGSGTLG